MIVTAEGAFTLEEANEICEAIAYAAPEDVVREEVRLANKYQVKPKTIRELVEKRNPAPAPTQPVKTTSKQKLEVLERLAAGEKVCDIAKAMGLPYSTVNNYKQRNKAAQKPTGKAKDDAAAVADATPMEDKTSTSGKPADVSNASKATLEEPQTVRLQNKDTSRIRIVIEGTAEDVAALVDSLQRRPRKSNVKAQDTHQPPQRLFPTLFTKGV